jgi:hypothetical protein
MSHQWVVGVEVCGNHPMSQQAVSGEKSADHCAHQRDDYVHECATTAESVHVELGAQLRVCVWVRLRRVSGVVECSSALPSQRQVHAYAHKVSSGGMISIWKGSRIAHAPSVVSPCLIDPTPRATIALFQWPETVLSD